MAAKYLVITTGTFVIFFLSTVKTSRQNCARHINIGCSRVLMHDRAACLWIGLKCFNVIQMSNRKFTFLGTNEHELTQRRA